MEKEKKFQNNQRDARDLEPRIIGEKIYRNPNEVCFDIDDVILRAAGYNREIPADLLQAMNKIFTLTDSVRSLFYIKEKNLDANVNPKDLIELSKNIKMLLENETF